MQALSINGQSMAYRYRKKGGPCVVFANSLGSDQSIWDEVINHLPRGLDTLTYDLRGHGHSAVADDYTIRDLANDLIGLMEVLKLSKVLLCGVSVGGMIAQDIAARRPDLVSSLILSTTASQIGNAEKWNWRIEAARTAGVASIADSILGNWFAHTYKTTHPGRWALHHTMLCRTSGVGYAATSAAIRDADLSEYACKITAPTLCIAGTEDKSVPPEQVMGLAKAIPNARYMEFNGVGHLPPLEVPEKVAALIAEMVSKAGSAPRFQTGMALRRAVLGNTLVDRAEALKTDFDTAFQTLITEGAWGTVWGSHGISHRERSMLTLALLAATGNFEEIPMHIRATLRTGASQQDIQEAFQHVAIYAGVPRANHALKLARKTLNDMKAEADDD